MSYEEEDTCMSYEEEDTCMSYKEEDTCMCLARCPATGFQNKKMKFIHVYY